MENLYDVTIIGAGPAGLTSAIYARRANLKTLVIENAIAGGKLYSTYEIENYPGIAKIGGSELGDQLVEHAKKYGTEIINAEVKDIDFTDKIKKVILDDNTSIQTKTIIIATGTKERKLNLEHAEDYTGKGISYCAVCDGFFYKNKDVVVIGGGNSALEESLYLASVANKVYIVIRRDVFRADQLIVDQIKNNNKIQIITKSLPESLDIINNEIKGLNIKNVETNEISKIECSGIFPFIGADPATNFVDKRLLNENGYIKVNEKMETIADGIYAAGDVINKELRQVVTACNDGAIAATNANKYIKEKF